MDTLNTIAEETILVESSIKVSAVLHNPHLNPLADRSPVSLEEGLYSVSTTIVHCFVRDAFTVRVRFTNLETGLTEGIFNFHAGGVSGPSSLAAAKEAAAKTVSSIPAYR